MAARTDPDPIFVEARPRRWLRPLALLAAAAAVLLVVSLLYAVRSSSGSPESTIEAYFAALADRDAEAALRLTAPEVAPGQPDVINDAVLRSPDYVPPAEVSVSRVTVTDRTAAADVAFTVDGQPHRVEQLRLRREGGLAGSLRPRWLLVDAFGTLLLREVPEQITVNGQPVAAYDTLGARILDALPGGYQIGVPEGDPLWQPRAVPARVGPQDATEVDVSLVPRPALRDEVDRQVVRLLDQCATSIELLPPDCPFGYQVSGGAEDVQWRIATYPNIGVSAGEDSDQPLAVVHTAREGEAVITGTRRFVGRFEETVPIPVTGTVTVSGDTVLFQPGW